jgi:hypothetical protein
VKGAACRAQNAPDLVTPGFAVLAACALLVWLVVRMPFDLPPTDRPALEAYATRPEAVATPAGLLLVQSPARIAVVSHDIGPEVVAVTVTATNLCSDQARTVSLGNETAALPSGGSATLSVADVSLLAHGRTTIDLTASGLACTLPPTVPPSTILRVDSVTVGRTP